MGRIADQTRTILVQTNSFARGGDVVSHPISVARAPWDAPEITLAGARPETEPRHFPVMEHKRRKSTIIEALLDALE